MRWLLSSMRFKPATWLLHIALAVILVGACVTHFFGVQGDIHLRADQAETLNYQSPITNHQSPITHHQSKITLFLWDFRIINDADGNPVDFISELRLLDRSQSSIINQQSAITVDEGIVRMNKPLKYHGWRFCQSDYDSDQAGVVLAYNYDPWGSGITYTGYALLLAGMIGFFFQKNTRFRVLLKKSVFGQRSGLAALAVIAILLAIVMTHVVTPKPPLQPVLQTPLLGIHVSVIMLAYTLFAIIAINGIVGLCSKRLSTTVFQLSAVLLYPALFCLTAGIFIGAVWANMSWGRYWGWDPKETWALITMLVYALLLHFPWLKNKCKISDVKFQIYYHILSIVAFFFVLFTYFGVSYLLGGLHSYA